MGASIVDPVFSSLKSHKNIIPDAIWIAATGIILVDLTNINFNSMLSICLTKKYEDGIEIRIQLMMDINPTTLFFIIPLIRKIAIVAKTGIIDEY